jgi:transcriptional regulator with XRE-family HTH domain
MKIEKARKVMSTKVLGFRIKNNLSVSEFSSMTKVSSRTIRRIELGSDSNYNPGLHNVIKISNATKIPLHTLTGQRLKVAV